MCQIFFVAIIIGFGLFIGFTVFPALLASPIFWTILVVLIALPFIIIGATYILNTIGVILNLILDIFGVIFNSISAVFIWVFKQPYKYLLMFIEKRENSLPKEKNKLKVSDKNNILKEKDNISAPIKDTIDSINNSNSLLDLGLPFSRKISIIENEGIKNKSVISVTILPYTNGFQLKFKTQSESSLVSIKNCVVAQLEHKYYLENKFTAFGSSENISKISISNTVFRKNNNNGILDVGYASGFEKIHKYGYFKPGKMFEVEDQKWVIFANLLGFNPFKPYYIFLGDITTPEGVPKRIDIIPKMESPPDDFVP